MKKKILLISDNDFVCNQTQRILSEYYILTIVSFVEIKDRLLFFYNIIIIDFNRIKVEEKKFKLILNVKCKSQAPILVLLEIVVFQINLKFYQWEHWIF